MNEPSKSHFSLLSEMEKQSRLWQAEQIQSKILLWSKGKKNRITFWMRSFEKKENQIILSGDTSTFPAGEHLLGSFELNGVNYFFKSKVIFQGIDNLKIDTTLDFYKSERRHSYRLLTYPFFQIYLEVSLAARYIENNVVNLQSKMSQTGLFKSFLRLIDGEKNQDDGKTVIRLRVQDLSVSGLSVLIGEAELPYFSENSTLEKISLVFPDESIIINGAKIVYTVNLLGGAERKVRQYKMGVSFPVSEQIDQILSHKINKMLRESDSNKEFEDFIN